jgi:hypothetical protein
MLIPDSDGVLDAGLLLCISHPNTFVAKAAPTGFISDF